MSGIFADVRAGLLTAWHDAAIANAGTPLPGAADDAWTWIATNHRCNRDLWAQEDAARRVDVPAEAIAANKRAIDGLNQRRNDAVERIDEVLLARIADVAPAPDAWHNAETAGAMIDRLSILALKNFHMGVETARMDATAGHRAACAAKLERLQAQRGDLDGASTRCWSARRPVTRSGGCTGSSRCTTIQRSIRVLSGAQSS